MPPVTCFQRCARNKHSHAITVYVPSLLVEVAAQAVAPALSCTVTLSPIGVVSVPLKPGGGHVIESAVGPMIIMYAAQLRNVRPHDAVVTEPRSAEQERQATICYETPSAKWSLASHLGRQPRMHTARCPLHPDGTPS